MTKKEKTLLIVEDDMITALFESKELENEGYAVIIATGGEEAIRTADDPAKKIDLILMDIDLGRGMDGTEAARIILSKHDIPVVFLSSHTEQEVVDKTEAITSYGYVLKNTGITVLAASIKMAFKLHEAHNAIKQRNISIQRTNEELQATNEELEASNEELLRSPREVLASEQRYRELYENLRDGSAAVDAAGRIIQCNQRFLDMLGYTFEEVKDLTYEDITPAPWHAMETTILKEQVLKRGYSDLYEKEYIRKDRHIFPIELQTYLVKDAAGNPAGFWAFVRDITERKRAESDLKEARDRAQRYLDTVDTIIVSLDNDGNITMLNRYGESILGYTEADLIGKHWFSTCLPQPDGMERVFPVFKEIVNGRIEAATYFENNVLTSRGEVRLIAWHNTYLHDNDEKIIGTLSAGEDITDRKRIEEELSFRNLVLTTQMETSIDGILVVGEKGKILSHNRRFAAMWGIPEKVLAKKSDELAIQTVLSRIKDPQQFADKVAYLYHHEDETSFDEIPLKDGRIFERYSAPMIGGNGAYQGRVWYFRDVTDRSKGENELRESEQKFRDLAEMLPQSVYECDLTGRVTYANQRALHDFRYTQEDLDRGINTLAITDRVDRIRISNDFQKILQGELLQGVEYRMLRKDGTSFDAVSYSVPIIRDGTITGLRGVMIDITDYKKSQAALKASEERYRTIFQNSPLGIITTTPTGRILSVNPAFCGISGYTEEELLRLSIADITPPEDYPNEVGYLRTARENMLPSVSFKKRYRTKSGENIWASISISFINNLQGMPDMAIGVVENIAERIRAEEERDKIQAQLIHAQKMNAIGTLASGIAHDFNNMLGGIMGSLNLLEILLDKENLEQKEAVMEYLTTAIDETDRAADIVRQLLKISRKEEQHPVPVDIAASLRQVETLCHNSLPKSVTLDFVIPPEPLFAHADPTGIEQVLLNLCVNAAHAMTIMRQPGDKEGGKLSVRAGEFIPDDHFKTMHPESLKDRTYIAIEITDTGVGMDTATQERIFDPFFSTKTKDSGTGLGLSIVYGIVSQVGGFIRVYSEKGHGSTFTLYLPTIPGKEHIVAKSRRHNITTQEKATILVIDDEPAIIRIAQGILTTYGHTVYTATRGDLGISLYRTHRKTIDLVLLDISLPGMTGFDILDALRLIDPAVKVILCSGYAEDERITDAIRSGAVGFLQKPYNADLLMQAVNKGLD